MWSAALGRLVYRGRPAADRRADERALLAADDSADTGTGGHGAADDQRRLRLRSLRTHIFLVTVNHHVVGPLRGAIHRAWPRLGPHDPCGPRGVADEHRPR